MHPRFTKQRCVCFTRRQQKKKSSLTFSYFSLCRNLNRSKRVLHPFISPSPQSTCCRCTPRPCQMPNSKRPWSFEALHMGITSYTQAIPCPLWDIILHNSMAAWKTWAYSNFFFSNYFLNNNRESMADAHSFVLQKIIKSYCPLIPPLECSSLTSSKFLLQSRAKEKV